MLRDLRLAADRPGINTRYADLELLRSALRRESGQEY
jgi:hypothetical protein